MRTRCFTAGIIIGNNRGKTRLLTIRVDKTSLVALSETLQNYSDFAGTSRSILLRFSIKKKKQRTIVDEFDVLSLMLYVTCAVRERIVFLLKNTKNKLARNRISFKLYTLY